MPAIDAIAARADEMQEWRRHLHRHPELGYDLPETARYVADALRAIGVDALHEGIAETGIVALIDGREPGPTIGLRADMDALPIHETTGAAHASTVPGRMHACGHDGHTAMLLGAARYLADTRAFSGRVALIFQPAEEGGAGGEAMVREGIMDRFDIAQVYGLHNVPGVPEGLIATRPGPLLAAADTFEITVTGAGGHGAMPHETRDPVPCAVAIAAALPTIVSRNRNVADDLVLSVTQIHAGSADNIVPGTAFLGGTVRTFDPAVQDMVERRMGEIVEGTAAAYGVEAALRFRRGYPATVNDPDRAAFAAEAAREVAGPPGVEPEVAPEMGAEDFAYMLQARPGAYLFVGAGPGAPLHHPSYDFNDAIAPIGASLFARLVERAQPLTNEAAV